MAAMSYAWAMISFPNQFGPPVIFGVQPVILVNGVYQNFFAAPVPNPALTTKIGPPLNEFVAPPLPAFVPPTTFQQVPVVGSDP